MNNLLSFNPEPFETDSEPARGRRGYDQSNDARGQDAELLLRRSYGRGFPPTSASIGVRRVYTKTTGAPFSAGLTRPSATTRRLPSHRRRSRFGRLSTFPVILPEWPLIPITDVEPNVAARREPESPGLASEHVRWVQSCLNQSMGLRLATDGIMNAETRSAIRSFQERRGMRIDGLVGPETERALAISCKEENSPPPVTATPGSGPAMGAQASELAGQLDPEWEFETVAQRRRWAGSLPGVSSIETPVGAAPFDSQTFRQRIVRIANQELARWGRGAIKETDPRILQTLQDYWKTGTGNNYSDAQLSDPKFQNDHPWSAAFISWVMRTAGAGNAFKYSSAHSTYTRWAKDNRVDDKANAFKAYRISEVAPQVGDIVCKRRAGSGATYDNIRPGMKTHCDIVTEVRPGRLVTIGGNVSNSVAQTTPRTDTRGFLSDPNYFAVIRVSGQIASIPKITPHNQLTPSISSLPKLLKREVIPPGNTLYVNIDLGIIDQFGITAAPVTGVFIPEGYAPGATVDVILYLHGHKAEPIRRQAIDQYWNSHRFPYGAFREGINTSGRNVILVAPTLGSRSETMRLLDPGGLDAYLNSVLVILRAYGPHQRTRQIPQLGNLIIASHSGGGKPMRELAGGRDRVLTHLRECWGFDCTYNRGDDSFWAGWARNRPNAKLYVYYIPGRKSGTAHLAENLARMGVPNAIVRPSRDGRHMYVPIAYWKERLQGTKFLATRSASTNELWEGELEGSWNPEVSFQAAIADVQANSPGLYTIHKNNKQFYVGKAENIRKRLLQHLWCLNTIADVKVDEYKVKLNPMPGITSTQLKTAESNLIAKWGLRKHGGLLTNTNTRELEEEIWRETWSQRTNATPN
jgi:peptidoglycan hydrolase-like protein with peptidoglycan-binding domain